GGRGDVGRDERRGPGGELLGEDADGAADLEDSPEVALGQGAQGHGALALLVPARREAPRVRLAAVELLEVAGGHRVARRRVALPYWARSLDEDLDVAVERREEAPVQYGRALGVEDLARVGADRAALEQRLAVAQ